VSEDEDDVVAEVARRVAERLQSKQNQQQMIDDLTERIFARITSK
jgi:predicted small metal-binding protein